MADVPLVEYETETETESETETETVTDFEILSVYQKSTISPGSYDVLSHEIQSRKRMIDSLIPFRPFVG
jgi:hypothetical protein